MLGTVGQIGIGILKQTYSDPKLKATLVKAHKWTGITLFIFALVTIASKPFSRGNRLKKLNAISRCLPTQSLN